MSQVSPIRVRLLVVWISALLLAGVVSPLAAQGVREMTFSQLVDKSEDIFVATCVEKKVVHQNGNIVTQYKLKPSEVWKGQLRLNKAGYVQMEEIGGQLPGPVPVGQFVPGMADMASGEEVLLFTSYSKASTAVKNRVTSIDSPHIINRWQGRYTLFKHPETGEKLAARANYSTVPGSAINPNLQKILMKQNTPSVRFDSVPSIKKQAAGKSAGPSNAEREMAQAKASMQQEQSRSLARTIKQATQTAKARKAVVAKKDPAAAEAIYQFEPLADIKSRVMQTLSAQKQKKK